MATDFQAIIKVAYNLAEGNKKLQSDLKEIQDKYKAQIGIDLDTKTAKKSLQQFSEQYKQALSQNKITFDNKLSTYLSNNTKLSKTLREEINKIKSSVDGVDNSEGLKNLQKQFSVVRSEAEKLGQTGDTAFVKLGKNAKQFLSYLGSATIIMSSVNAVKKMISSVYELDTSMTSLFKVTDNTNREYDDFLDNAINKSQKLATSLATYVNQTAEWSKAGYSLFESAKLAEISTIFQNVGDIDAATSVSDIVTPLKAFNIEASKAITVVDALNEVDNRFSVSAADIGNGLKNSASALALANNDINQSIAMITGGSEITQSADEMGTAVKVLSMRLRGMKGELESIGEEYENIDSVSKIQTQIYNLTKGSVNIMDDLDPTKFKSTYEIMEQISKVWSKISETDQAQLLEIIAGKNRGNDVAALISSFQSGQAQKAYTTALTSNGSAYKEQEKWMNSLQAKVQQFQSSLEGLSAELVDSDFLKVIVDGGTGAINTLSKLVDTIGLLPAVLTTVGGILLFWKSGLLPAIAKEFLAITLAETGFQAASVRSAATNMGLSASFSTLAKSMKAVALAHPLMLGALAIGGIVALTDALDNAINSTESAEKSQENLQKAIAKYDESTGEVSRLEGELENCRTKIEEINSLDGAKIARAGELETLKSQTEELQRQLDIAKESQRIALEEAEKKAIKVVQSVDYESRYTDDGEKAGAFDFIDRQRTYELKFAIADYDDLKKQYDELLLAQQELANESKGNTSEFKDNEEQLKSLSKEMKSAKDYANELATGLTNDSKNIVGVTDKGKELKSSLDSLLTTYDVWLNKITGNAEGQRRAMETMFNSENFTKYREELIELAKTGDLSDDLLKYGDNYGRLSKETGMAVSDIKSYIYDLVNAEKAIQLNSTLDVNAINEKVDSLGSKFQDLEGYVSDLSDEDFSFGYDEIEKVKELYPELESAIYKTADGWRIEQSAIDDVKVAMSDMSVEFQNAETNITNWLNSETGKRLNMYGLEIKTLEDLANLRAGDEMRKQQELGIGKQSLETMNPELYAELKMYQESAKEIEAAKKKLEDLKSGGVSGGSSKKKTGSSEKDKKEFSGSIDWITQSLQNLQNGVSDAQNKLNDTEGYEKQIDAIEALIGSQNKLKDGYKSASDSYNKQFKSISGIDKYKELIKGGKTFTSSDFTDETLYNTVKNAQDIWNNYQDMLDKLASTNGDISDSYDKIKELQLKSLKETLDESSNTLKDIVSNYEKAFSTIKNLGDGYDDGSSNQLDTYLSGIKKAKEEITYLNSQLANLNKMKKDGSFKENMESYAEQVQTINDALFSAKNTLIDFNKAIGENAFASLEPIVDFLEKENEAIVSSIEKERDAFSELVASQKELLDLKEKQRDYEKSIADQTKDIAKIESRMAELQKAALTGDRKAAAELKQLNEEVVEKKDDLAEDQHDHELDLQKDALDKASDDNEKIANAKLDSIKTEFNARIDSITKVYEEEKRLISEMNNYRSSEFNKLFDEQVSKLASLGVVQSEDYVNSIKDAQKGVANQGSGSTAFSGDSSKDTLIRSKLSSGTSTTGDSELNKFVKQNYGSYLSFKEMVEIAKLLGVKGITSEKDVQGNSANREAIRKALIANGFDNGGTIGNASNGGLLVDLLKSSKDNVLIPAKTGEGVLTNEQNRAWLKLVPQLTNLSNLLPKITTSNISNLVTTNNSSPVIHIDKLIDFNGANITGDNAVAKIKASSNDIFKQIMDEARIR